MQTTAGGGENSSRGPTTKHFRHFCGSILETEEEFLSVKILTMMEIVLDHSFQLIFIARYGSIFAFIPDAGLRLGHEEESLFSLSKGKRSTQQAHASSFYPFALSANQWRDE